MASRDEWAAWSAWKSLMTVACLFAWCGLWRLVFGPESAAAIVLSVLGYVACVAYSSWRILVAAMEQAESDCDESG